MKLLDRHAFFCNMFWLHDVLQARSRWLPKTTWCLVCQQNPAEEEGLEAACVALQLGTLMLKYESTTNGPCKSARGRHGHDLRDP